MADDYECDAAILKSLEDPYTPEKRITDSVALIEETLEWFDHVALAFLVYDDPTIAWQKIQAVMENYKLGQSGWRHIVLGQLFKCEEEHDDSQGLWKKLISALLLLKHHRLLEQMEITVHSVCLGDPFRQKLFEILDNLSSEEAQLLIDQMNSKNSLKNTDPSWSVEMHFLKWIIDKEISATDMSKLVGVASKNGISVEQNVSSRTWKPSSPTTETSLSRFKISRGLCVIINQMSFYVNYGLAPEFRKQAKEGLDFRFGSEVDRDKLSETFLMLGHDVEVYENLDRERLFSTLSQIATKRDFRRYDGLVICILSHGERDCVFSSDSIPIPLDEIKREFDAHRCAELMNKPKLFFLQACQGQESQKLVNTHEEWARDGSLPAVCNFFEAWATVPGFYSYRSTYKGAVFVRELCAVLQESGHKESLFDVMAMVNDRVSRWESADGKKMICSTTHCLTRGVQFSRGDKEKLVQGIVDQLERDLLKDVIELAACKLWQTDKLSAFKIIESWKY